MFERSKSHDIPIIRRLRFKLIASVLLVTLSLSLLLTVVLGYQSMSRYKQFERQQARQQVEQAEAGLAQLQQRVSIMTQDWATWDGAYDYVQNPDRRFVESNMGEATFSDADLNLIILLDVNNQVLAAEGYDLPGQPEGWMADASAYARAMLDAKQGIAPPHSPDEPTAVDGLMGYDGHGWLLSSKPVLRTDGSGPAMGRFLFIRLLDERAVAELRELLEYDVMIVPPVPDRCDEAWFTTQGLDTITTTKNVQSTGDYHVIGVRVVASRDVYTAGLDGLRSMFLVCLGCGVVISLFLASMLERLIVRRIRRLSDEADAAGRDGRVDACFAVSGSDEIARLGVVMNQMVQGIQQSQAELERTQHTVDMARIAIFWLNPEGRFCYINAAACELSGYREDELLGRELAVFDPACTPEHWAQNWDSFPKMDSMAFETTCRRKDGEMFEAEFQVSRIDVDGQELLFATVTDIADRKAAERRLVEQATSDKLTGLPNRVWLLDRLTQLIASGTKASVLYLDLDRFKLVNDALGHEAGDQLLCRFAERMNTLMKQFCAGDVGGCRSHMARLGGDEFVVLLEHPEQQAEQGACSCQTACGLASQIVDLFEKPFEFDGHTLFSSTSIGIVEDMAGYEKAIDVLRDADTAMYEAKRGGRNASRVFTAEMHKQVVERLELERELRDAMQRQSFEVFYQPIVNIEGNTVHGFEALLRWKRADGIPVSPDVFIPIAEESGLIKQLGAFVIEQACRQLAAWGQQHPGRNLTMAINISRHQLLLPGLAQHVTRVTQETGVRADRLEFEVTESVLIEDFQDATNTLDELRAMGIQISMDDFGTGYSSLSCLHEFPTQLLKIDRAFISNMSMNIEYAAVTHAIITLAHNMGMRVIAEGIENTGQLAQLQALECDYGQGYLFAKPMQAQDADQWLAGQMARPAASKSA